MLPNFFGFTTLMIYNAFAFFYQMGDRMTDAGFISFYGLMVLTSICLFFYCGEANFEPCGDPSGPYGVGC
jgi:hypothetical protein